MAVTARNSLSGPLATTPDDTSLATTAQAGTVTITNPGQAEYSDDRDVHALSTIRIDTGHSRDQGGGSEPGLATPRMEVALPSPPWTVRMYVRLPDSLQDEGHGVDEVRYLCQWGTGLGLVLHETSGGNIGTRLQPSGLAQADIQWDELQGSAVTLGQWWRLDLLYDGSDLEMRAYAGQSTSGERIYPWTGVSLPGPLTITGYRYRRDVLLQPGDNDADLDGTPIEDRQNQLLAWDPNALPQFGADGDYGSETTEWVENFQTAHGFSLIDGEIGPETGAAMDLTAAMAQGDPLPEPVYVSHLAIADTGAEIGPADTPGGQAVTSLAAMTASSEAKTGAGDAATTLALETTVIAARGGPATTTLAATGTAEGTKSTAGTAEAALGLAGTVQGTKHASGQAVATLGVTGTTAATKSVGGQAVTTLAATGHVQQLIELIPPLAALARATDRLRGDAVPIGRPAATAAREGRLGGQAGRGY